MAFYHKGLSKTKRIFLLGLFVLVFLSMGFSAALNVQAEEKPNFTAEEQALIHSTQETPIKIGIIPHAFPLSTCEPEEACKGINIEILNLISKKTGLKFQFQRIPTETHTPYQFLATKETNLVAGAIITENFLADPTVVLSERLFDSSAVCIGKDGVNLSQKEKPLTIAVMSGFQVGTDYAQRQFPDAELLTYATGSSCLDAVKSKKADMAILNKYVGNYELQKPKYTSLSAINAYTLPLDGCIMGLSPNEDKTISVINKGLSAISEEEYSSILMDFTIANPYQYTFFDILYKYRVSFCVIALLLALLSFSFFRLNGSRKREQRFSYDKLTGALTQNGFDDQVSNLLQSSQTPAYIVDFDISNFEGYNQLNGREKGDLLLKDLVLVAKDNLYPGEYICRTYSDHFAMVLLGRTLTEQIKRIAQISKISKEHVSQSITLSYGVYEVVERNLPIDRMIGFAASAKRTIKGNTQNYIAVYDDHIYKKNLANTEFLACFESALKNEEFHAYYQPKYDCISQQCVGAEALVRWFRPDGAILLPGKFIQLFERNGQIIALDFYMLRQACQLQKQLLDSGIHPVPISVNFSRIHFYDNSFVPTIIQIVDQCEIPHSLIEIECTETSITEDLSFVCQIFQRLRKEGFILSMDDFGSGYSSLNTLKSLPLDVIKLDRGFFVIQNIQEDQEQQRAKEIIKSVISLAKTLSLKTVAEGVETKEQLEFLRSIGCDTIQGYYFSKPVDKKSYIALFNK
ncbi:MAG: EAL domain-containing protein, partial [Anaerovoracaceae bacterium]